MQTSFDNQPVFQTLNAIMQSAPASNAMATAAATPGTFKDSDGLISFVNLKSSFVTTSPSFTTGQEICDKVATFFASMRIKVFAYLKQNPAKVLPGDTPPVTQWDLSVTKFIQNLLVDAGGFSAFQVVQETFSETQTVVEFSTEIIKMIFDAMVLPENIVADATKFIQGVGSTLRFSWDDKSKSYRTCLVGICHEAVQIDNSGNGYYYLPKIKYYYISVNSSQQEFTSPCVNVQNITFNFTYDYYAVALKASVLDNTTDDYKKFVAFLDKAQDQNYKNADNTLDSVMGTSSTAPATNARITAFGTDISEYPKVAAKAPILQ